MSYRMRLRFFASTLLVTALIAGFVLHHTVHISAAGGPVAPPRGSYRVLAPIESGNLLLFPVVQSGKTATSSFLTLDEGIKSGQVEVTEAGRVRGLVRPRPTQGKPGDGLAHPIPTPDPPQYRGDQVN